MVGKKKMAALLTAILWMASMVPAFAADTPIQIGIIQYVSHSALDATNKGFIQALADQGYVDGQNIQIDQQNAQADQSNLSTIADRFVSNKMDLVLAIATPAAQAMAGKTSEIPILGTAITDYEVANLVQSNDAPGYNVSGTSDMNPVSDQIALLQKLVPSAKKVGVLYTASEDNSVLQARIAKDAIEKAGMQYVEMTVNTSNDVQQATEDLVQKCDVLYIPTDNIVSSAMPIVYQVTVEGATPKPVICGEAAMVENGGLATLGINYYDLGYQTGMMAARILSGEVEISAMPIAFANGFDFAINGTVANMLGIEIPADMQDSVIEMTK